MIRRLSCFNMYDAIAMYSVGGKLQDIYGYQLKEGKANPKKSSHPLADFGKSFVVKGDPPKTDSTKDGWSTACGDTINNFFGASGKYWTPQHWKLLTDTLHLGHNRSSSKQ